MSEPFDAALRVNGEIVFRDDSEAIDQRLAAEVEYDEARDAVIAAARVVLVRGRLPDYAALREALERHDRARAAYYGEEGEA